MKHFSFVADLIRTFSSSPISPYSPFLDGIFVLNVTCCCCCHPDLIANLPDAAAHLFFKHTISKTSLSDALYFPSKLAGCVLCEDLAVISSCLHNHLKAFCRLRMSVKIFGKHNCHSQTGCELVACTVFLLSVLNVCVSAS